MADCSVLSMGKPAHHIRCDACQVCPCLYIKMVFYFYSLKLKGRSGCSTCTCFHLYTLPGWQPLLQQQQQQHARKAFGLPGRSSGMQAQVWANVCRLRNVAWATGGREEGNPLSADVVVQPLSRFKGCLGRDEKRKKIHRHTP